MVAAACCGRRKVLSAFDPVAAEIRATKRSTCYMYMYMYLGKVIREATEKSTGTSLASAKTYLRGH